MRWYKRRSCPRGFLLKAVKGSVMATTEEFFFKKKRLKYRLVGKHFSTLVKNMTYLNGIF